MNKKTILVFILLLPFILRAQVPTTWTTTGIGGGSGFYSPSVNPADSSEFYVSCEMGELFHTKDYGANYSIVDFNELQAYHNSVVRFTIDPNIRYSINYSNTLGFPVVTNDGGATWAKLPNNPDTTSEVFGIWVDYNNPNRIILSTQSVVWFSGDGGNTFSLAHFRAVQNIGVLVAGVFFDGSNIYVGTNDGLLESTNGGGSFTILPTTGIIHGESIASFAAAKKGSSLRFFCLTGDSTSLYPGLLGSNYIGFVKHIYMMNNNNGTWTQSMNGIDVSSDYMMFVAMAENDTATAYLGGSSALGQPNIMKTTDGGNSWTHVLNIYDVNGISNQNIYTGWCGDSGDYNWNVPECILGISVSPKNKNVVVIADFNQVMKTNDGGVSWKQGYVAAADQHAPGVATPVKKYYNSVGLESSSCWYLHWTDANNLFAGCSNLFGIRSKDSGNSWSFDYTSTSPSKNTVYCVAQNSSNGRLYAGTSSEPDLYKIYELQDFNIDAKLGEVIVSNDTGATWTVLRNFSHPVYWLATHPTNSNKLYAAVANFANGAGGIWVTDSVNKGASAAWTHLSAPPRTQGHPATVTVLKNGNLVCSYSARRGPGGALGINSGVFLYKTDSAKWFDRSAVAMQNWSRDVVVDQNDTSQNTWYCGVYEGFNGRGINTRGLYRTTNGGVNWTRIFSGGDVSSCAINPKNKNEMFVTTNGNGLWYCLNINTPTPAFTLVESYPFSAPERVFFNPFNQNKIWVTSFGHGLQWADKTTTEVINIERNNNHLLLYPNPASNNITINMGEKILTERALADNLKVFDLAGREVDVNVYMDGYNINIGVGNLPAGLYLVQLKLDDQLLTCKLVKQ